VEILEYPLWDSVTLGSSDLSASLFKIPIGSSSKTKYNTNLENAGQLPVGYQFTIKAISWMPLPGTVAADLLALSKGYLELFVGSLSKFIAPLFLLPSGAGFAGVSTQALATGGVDYWFNGIPDARSIYSLEYPIELRSGVSIKVDLIWGTAPGAKTLWVFLHGYMQKQDQI
jgi:hypothetical protein